MDLALPQPISKETEMLRDDEMKNSLYEYVCAYQPLRPVHRLDENLYH